MSLSSLRSIVVVVAAVIPAVVATITAAARAVARTAAGARAVAGTTAAAVVVIARKEPAVERRAPDLGVAIDGAADGRSVVQADRQRPAVERRHRSDVLTQRRLDATEVPVMDPDVMPVLTLVVAAMPAVVALSECGGRDRAGDRRTGDQGVQNSSQRTTSLGHLHVVPRWLQTP